MAKYDFINMGYLFVLLLIVFTQVASENPIAHKDAVFPVIEVPSVLYAQGVQCKSLSKSLRMRDFSNSRRIQIAPSKYCPKPTIINLTLDVYLPDDGPNNIT